MLKRLLLFYCTTLLLVSCQNTKSIPQEGNDIEISKAVVQKFVPGVQGAKIVDQLTLEMNEFDTSKIHVDSLYYKGVVYSNIKNVSKIEVSMQQPGPLKSLDQYSKIKPDEAVLYYRFRKKRKFIKIADVKRLDDVYMP